MFSRFKLPNYSSTQAGFAPIVVVLLLLLGVGATTVLVQRGTSFIPFADCNPGIDNNCDTGGGSEDDPGEKAAQQKEEQANLEKGAAEAGKSVEDYKVDDCKANSGKSGCDEILKKDQEKKSGSSGSSGSEGSGEKVADPKKDCDQISYCEGEQVVKKSATGYTSDGKCDYQFSKTSEESDKRCVNHTNGFLVETTNISKTEGKASGTINSGVEISKLGDQGCDTFTYCGPNNKKVRKVQVFDSNKNACGDAKQVETEESCAKPGEVLAGVKDDPGLAELAKQAARSQQIQDDKIQLDAVRKQLSDDGYSYDANKSPAENKEACKASGKSEESCNANIDILEKIVGAQIKLDETRVNSDACINSGNQAACAVASAGHTQAVLASRAAVVNGMLASDNPTTGVCVKADFGNTKNLIEASPGQTSGGSSRVFMCRKSSGDKSLVLRVRDSSGNLVDVSEDDKKRLGWKEGAKTYNEIPPEFQVNVKNANCAASGICNAAIPGQTATSATPNKTTAIPTPTANSTQSPQASQADNRYCEVNGRKCSSDSYCGPDYICRLKNSTFTGLDPTFPKTTCTLAKGCDKAGYACTKTDRGWYICLQPSRIPQK